MTNPDFNPGKDIEFYFKRNFNVYKHRELTTNPDFKKLFNPRGFGILLWETHEHIIFYKNNHLKIIRYFASFRFSKRQMIYLLENLQLTFNKSLFPYQGLHGTDNELNLCLDFISIKCDKLTCQLNTDIYKQCYLFDFTFIKRNLELIPGIFDRIKYLMDIKTDFQQYEFFPGLTKQTYFINHCEAEIDRYLKLLKYEKFQLSTSNPTNIPPPAAQFKSAQYISKYIADKIYAIDASQWKYVFKTEEDFTFFLNLLTDYFCGNPIDHDFSLDLRPRCKTRLCPVINKIYHKFDLIPLKTNTLFLSIFKNLSIFNNQTLVQIYTALIKHSD